MARNRACASFLLLVLILNVAVNTLSSAAGLKGRNGPHISSLNLLLPPQTTRPVHHRVFGYNGCFTWSCDHNDVLSVEPEFNDTTKHCSTSAVLTSIAPFTQRRATAVHATDIGTGLVLRCEVFIDKISRIRIFHQSLKLDLDGVATLRIRAFDSEDNVFSSLVGLQFTWQLSPVSALGGTSIHRLIHVPLKDTALEDSEIETQKELEKTGVGSDLYVVRGVVVGQERVTVHLMEPLYEDIADLVILTVAEALSLQPPSPVYIIPGTSLQYTLKILRRKLATVLSLPSAHHIWNAKNTSVAEIDPRLGKLIGLTHGVTSIVVQDTRVEGHQQISTLHVVTPSRLRLLLTPLPADGVDTYLMTRELSITSSAIPWHLVVGRKYVVQVLTFSKESEPRPLQLTKDNDLRRMFENRQLWSIGDVPESIAEQCWQNCSLLHAIHEGTGTLAASLTHGTMIQNVLTGTWHLANTEVLQDDQKVVVCDPVRITASHADELGPVLLPWIANRKQQCDLFVEGGCGVSSADYLWVSSNPGKVSVDAHLGIVEALGIGKAVIRVSSARDSTNFDEVIVEVSIPASISIFPGLPMDVEVPGSLPVAVSLLTVEGQRYSRCELFNSLVQWEISGGGDSFTLFESSKMPHLLASQDPGPCAWSLLRATDPGRATVSALLRLRDSLLGRDSSILPRLLETSWTVIAYIPMWLEQVGDGTSFGGYSYKGAESLDSHGDTDLLQKGLKELLLVLGSSSKVTVQGGPDLWREGVDFIECVKVESDRTSGPSRTNVVHFTESDSKTFLLTCNGLGKQTLSFRRGKLLGNSDSTRTSTSLSLTVLCVVPSSVVLLVDEPDNNLPSIKHSAQADHDGSGVQSVPVSVANSRTIRLSAVAMVGGRAVANASSLFLEWRLTECNGLAKWQLPEVPDWIGDEGSWERYLMLSDEFGECIVSATAGGYRSSKHLGADVSSNIVDDGAKVPSILKDAARLQLVAPLRLLPSRQVLFWSVSAEASFLVLGGTSAVETSIQDAKVAMLSHHPRKGLGTLVVGAKGLGTTFVTARDVGLTIPSEASAMVVVTDVTWVTMLIPEDASIQIGSNITIRLEAGNDAGYVFGPSQFQYMNVKIHQQDDILEVIDQRKFGIHKLSADSFIVRGARVGITSTLHVSVQGSSGQEVFSDYGRVAVYAPLSIHPRSLVIPPGGTYVFRALGGPWLGASVEFSTSTPEIATIDVTSGMLKAVAVGDVTIHAQARTPGGYVITEDSLDIRVQILSGPSLNVKGGKLAVGEEMSIFATGAEEDLLSFVGVCADYKWTIANDTVLSLRQTVTTKDIRYVKDEEIQNDITGRELGLASGLSGYDSLAGTGEGFSARVFGRSAGRTEVTVSFVCQFGDIMDPKQYRVSENIWVVPPPPLALGILATWQLQPQYTSSRLLPQWPGEFMALADTGGIGHTVQYTGMHGGSDQLGTISITEDGRIHTRERSDIECILAEDLRSGRKEVAACIRVAEVAQVMFLGGNFPFHVAELSVGTSRRYIVRLADHFGIPFFESGGAMSLLVLETNRADLVSTKVSDCEHHEKQCNATITVQALKQGTAIVRVSFKGLRHIVDFFLVKVGTHVGVRSPALQVGSEVNFTVVGKGRREGERGSWKSTNPGVLDIDGQTGQAKAVSEGIATVSYGGSQQYRQSRSALSHLASVRVEPPSNIEELTNVGHDDDGFRFPVIFSDDQGNEIVVSRDAHDVPYECRSEPENLGLAIPWREPGSSTFSCMFYTFSPSDIHRLEGSGKLAKSSTGLNGKMQVVITAVVAGDPPVSGSVEVPMIGGFQIMNTPKQLQLSSALNRSLITVVGNCGQLQFEWERKNALTVRRVSQTIGPSGVTGRAEFEVKVSAFDQPFRDTIVFSLPISGQTEEKVVSYVVDAQTQSSIVNPLVAAVVLVAALLVLTLIVCARMTDIRHPPPVPYIAAEPKTNGEPLLSGEVTPPPTRTRFGQTSPPQPYTDYISRTMEKAPYYRKEGFRWFDPSRTY